MPLLFYVATATAMLAMTHRWVRRLSRPAIAILLLLPLCFVAYALLTGRAYAPVDLPYATEPLLAMKTQYDIGVPHAGILSDVAGQMIPWRKTVQWSLQHHQWPIWNPFMLSGDILAAAAQPAPYSPFTLLACLLPVATSFTYSAAIAFFIASLGAFLFARELGCGEPAAFAGAAAWTYSTDIAFFVLWPLGFAWTFLPLVLLGTRRVVHGPSVRSTALLTVALTLLLLAGHPETALHVVFCGVLYGFFELASFRAAIRRAIVCALAAGAITLLLCAVFVLPILEALPQSEQAQARAQFFATQPRGSTTANVLARLAIDFVPSLHLAHWWNPAVNDTAADTSSVGSIALALALYAIWRVRTRETWFFAALAVFCMLARADWWPVARLLQKLPLFDVTVNDRLSFAAAFSFSILVSFAVDDFLASGRRRGLTITLTVVLLIIASANVVVAKRNVATDLVRDFGTYTVFAEIAGLAAVALIFLAPVSRQWAVASIVGVILVQRALTIGGLYRSFPARSAYPPVPVFASLRTIREPFRLTGIGLTFIPNQSALYELEDVRGYEALTLGTYAETWRLWCAPQIVSFNRIDDLTKPFLSFLNVRYAVVWPKYQPPAGWRVAATQRGCTLIENLNVIPRAFVPHRVRFYDVAWHAVNEMSAETDFRERAWIRAGVWPERENGPGEVSIVHRPYGYVIGANMQHDGWVVISEAAWNGWRAYIDGRRVAMQDANAAFLSVFVPAGRHTVKLVYKPQSFVTGRAVTIATLLCIAIAAAVASVHHRRLGLQ